MARIAVLLCILVGLSAVSAFSQEPNCTGLIKNTIGPQISGSSESKPLNCSEYDFGNGAYELLAGYYYIQSIAISYPVRVLGLGTLMGLFQKDVPGSNCTFSLSVYDDEGDRLGFANVSITQQLGPNNVSLVGGPIELNPGLFWMLLSPQSAKACAAVISHSRIHTYERITDTQIYFHPHPPRIVFRDYRQVAQATNAMYLYVEEIQ